MSLFDTLLLDPAPFQIWIANRSDLLTGSGTASDPYNGGVVGGVSQFDIVMNRTDVALANVVIHLGPGTFVTNGYADNVVGGWKIQPGMKILGSGIDVTILQINNTSMTAARHYFAVGHPVLASDVARDYFELSDLTVDANLPSSSTLVACGAVRVLGSYARIRRVKAINWGTNSVSVPCYVFSLLTANPGATPLPLEAVNCGIEDCYGVKPATTVAGGSVTVVNVGSQLDLSFTSEIHAKSPFVRNCYVDCGVGTPSVTAPIFRALSMGWCRGGVLEGNQIYNADIGGPYQDGRSVRDMIVRNNFFKNVARGPFLNLGQVITTNLTSGGTGITWSSGIGHVSGGTMNLASLSNGDRVSLKTTPTQSTVDGVYVVTNLTGNTRFDVVTNVASPVNGNISSIQKILSVGRAIVEGNVIELAPNTTAGQNGVALGVSDNNAGGTPYIEPPDYAHGDIVFRNNKIRYVDGVFNASNLGYGSDVSGAKNLQVLNNVVDCAPVNPLKNSRTGNATYFNNLTSNGVLIQGFKADAPTKKYDELATQADDAFVMAFAEGT